MPRTISRQSLSRCVYLRLSDDVLQWDEAAADRLLLLLFEADLYVPHHGDQSHNALVMFQAFLSDQ